MSVNWYQASWLYWYEIVCQFLIPISFHGIIIHQQWVRRYLCYTNSLLSGTYQFSWHMKKKLQYVSILISIFLIILYCVVPSFFHHVSIIFHHFPNISQHFPNIFHHFPNRIFLNLRCLSFDSYIILWDLFESPGELRDGCSLAAFSRGRRTGHVFFCVHGNCFFFAYFLCVTVIFFGILCC